MDREDSLQRSQKSVTGPHLEPEESSPQRDTLFKNHFIIILPSMPRFSKLTLSFNFSVRTWSNIW